MTEWGVPRQKRIDQQSRYGIRAAVAQDGQTEPGLTDESSKPTVLLVWRHSLGWTPLTIAITPQQVPISIYQEGNICFVKQLDHACRRPLLDQDRSSAGMPWVFARLGSFHVFLSILFMILDLQPGTSPAFLAGLRQTLPSEVPKTTGKVTQLYRNILKKQLTVPISSSNALSPCFDQG